MSKRKRGQPDPGDSSEDDEHTGNNLQVQVDVEEDPVRPVKVFIISGGNIKTDEKLIVTTLPHPSTGEEVKNFILFLKNKAKQFLLNFKIRFLLRGNCLLEIQKMEREGLKKTNNYFVSFTDYFALQKGGLGCWFLKDSVSSDGSLYVATPFDPLFLVLHLFMRGQKQNISVFKSIEDLLTESANDVSSELDFPLVLFSHNLVQENQGRNEAFKLYITIFRFELDL